MKVSIFDIPRALLQLSTITGMSIKLVSALIVANTALPSTFGKLRSRSMRFGRDALAWGGSR